MCARKSTPRGKCPIDDYIQPEIPGSPDTRLNTRYSPGTCPHCNHQPLKQFRRSNENLSCEFFNVKLSSALQQSCRKPTYVTRWAKTRHIPHFVKIEIRSEIGISIFNYTAVQKWQWSVAWFPSYRAKRITDTEHRFSRKRNVFTLLQHTVMSPYTIVLRKIASCSCKKAARKSARTVGNDSGGESGSLHCVYRQKDNHTQTGNLWKLWKLIAFFENACFSCP